MMAASPVASGVGRAKIGARSGSNTSGGSSTAKANICIASDCSAW
jgi:hypothetical protein